MFFLMGILAAAGIYLLERKEGEKEAVKSAKIVLLVFLFLLWLVLFPFIAMANTMSGFDGVYRAKFWGCCLLPLIFVCGWRYYKEHRAGVIDWKRVYSPLKIYILMVILLEIIPMGFLYLVVL